MSFSNWSLLYSTRKRERNHAETRAQVINGEQRRGKARGRIAQARGAVLLRGKRQRGEEQPASKEDAPFTLAAVSKS